MNHLKHGKVIKHTFRLSALTVSCILAFNAQAAMDCSTIEPWDSAKAYSGGAQVQETNKVYKANWWSQGNNPTANTGEWSFVDDCSTGGGNAVPTVSLTSPSGTANITAGDTVSVSLTPQILTEQSIKLNSMSASL